MAETNRARLNHFPLVHRYGYFDQGHFDSLEVPDRIGASWDKTMVT